jgi:hypothetical protein
MTKRGCVALALLFVGCASEPPADAVATAPSERMVAAPTLPSLFAQGFRVEPVMRVATAPASRSEDPFAVPARRIEVPTDPPLAAPPRATQPPAVPAPAEPVAVAEAPPAPEPAAPPPIVVAAAPPPAEIPPAPTIEPPAAPVIAALPPAPEEAPRATGFPIRILVTEIILPDRAALALRAPRPETPAPLAPPAIVIAAITPPPADPPPLAPPVEAIAAPMPAAMGSPDPEEPDGPRVQLAAAQSRAGAVAFWEEFARRAPDLVDGRTPVIVTFERRGMPTVWRLRVGGFGDVAQAFGWCSRAKSRGMACWVAV